LIKDMKGSIFGGFISPELKKNTSFYGTGECFIFSWDKEQQFNFYKCTGENSLFVYVDSDGICMGSE